MRVRPAHRPVWGWGHPGLPVTGREQRGQRVAARGLAVVLGLLVLACFFLWEMARAGNVSYARYASDTDEGIYVVSAQLLLKGYPLFQDVFSSQPAFFLPSLATVLRVAGNPIVGGHLYAALCGLAVLAGVFWLAWTAYRPLAAPLAVALLAVSPGFLLYAHAVVAETPMLGLCLLAVAAAQSYYLCDRRRMAALAGLLFAGGSEMKLLSVMVVPPLALLLLGGMWRARHTGRPWRALAGDAATFALCALVPLLLVLAAVASGAQLRQVVAFHLAASHALPLDAAVNLDHLGGFLWRYDPGLLGLAIVGAGVGLLGARCARRRYLPLVYILWLLADLVFLARYHPLAQHQFLPLLPPLALLAVAPTGVLTRRRMQWRLWRRVEGMPRSRSRSGVVRPRVLATATGLALVAYLVVLAVQTLPLDGHLFAPTVLPRRAPLIALLERDTRPGDFVVGDDPMVALGAHRLMPPGLEDLSLVRAAAGYLTLADAVATTRRYRPAAIVITHLAQSRLPAGYVAWVRRHYHQVSSPVRGTQVYLRGNRPWLSSARGPRRR